MKLEEIRRALRDAPFEALLLTSEENRRYASGFPSSAGVCYISGARAALLTDFRYAEAARAQVTGMEVIDPAGRSYSECINALLEQDSVETVALEDLTLTHDAYLRWKRSLHVPCVHQGDLMQRLRACKEDDEVEHICAAQRIAEQALEEVKNDLRVGVSEKEIAARLTYLMLHHGAENMSFDPIVVSGANSSKPHGVPTEKTLQDGDFVTMDFGCIVNGYCSDMTRTVAIGHATEKMRLVYETVLEAQLAGIARAKAGVPGRDVDRAAREVIEKAGFGEAFGHGFGHSVGLEIHESPNASPSSAEPLPAGAVVTAEPGIYLPGEFGVRIEDMLYVIEDGCINLTEAPKQLLIL